MVNPGQSQRNDAPRGLMICVVPKQNIEVLGRALHALAKVGEELYVEPVETGLTFRTVHANHSVYAEVHFLESFFAFYQNPAKQRASRSPTPEDDEVSLNCRITMKSCLAAFRSLPCLRRQVETCLLQIEPTWLTVKFRCHHSLVRSHRLPVIECESLQANYAENEVPNNLAIGPSTFAAAIKNFQCSEKDITLDVDKERAVLKNFVSGGADPKVRSTLKLEKAEFTSFRVSEETAITFCLKTFRAVLFFSEPAEYPLNIKFSSPGSPVIVINTAPLYELRFVLSSLSPEDCDVSRTHSQQMLTPLRAIERNRKKTASRPRRPSSDTDHDHDPNSESAVFSDSTSQNAPERLAEPGPSSSRREQPDLNNRPSTSHGRQSSPQQSNHAAVSQRCPSSQTSVASTAGASVGTAASARKLSLGGRRRSEDKPVPSGLRWGVGSSPAPVPESDEEMEEADKPEEEEVVPGTPPLPEAKRVRRFFQRCFEPTLNATALLDHTVLAEDSD